MASRASKNRHGVKKKRTLAGSMTVVAIVLVIVLGVVGGGAALLSSWFKDLPDYEGANAFNTSLPTYVYASDGETVLARFQLEYREPVEMDQINPYLPAALIATEDARFYEHGGIDLYGVMRALANNIVGGEIEGASTITQQFIRNTILADEMSDISIKRKAREAYLAMQMEKRYTKDEILLMYLNTINFGEGAYGAEAAAQRYFSKPATDLTLAEAALLAGIPQSPTYNDPLEYPEHALERRAKVLSRMLEENVIAKEEYDEAMATPLQLNPKDIQDDGIQAYPYFTSYVRWLLYNNYDLSEADILKGGLSVYTTLDIGRQQAAEEACAAKRDALSGDMEVAMAVVEPETGYIQALVGGRDYYESQVNLATGHGGGGRPCGSVFKMFTLAEAVKKGIDPKTTYVDCSSPATVDGYTLENYGNSSLGTRSIASAFAASSNTGFVRLISSVGVKDTAKMAYDLGVTTDLLEDEAGATLTLGVQNITPLELAGAAAAIANGGVHHDLCAITVIKDRDGKVLVDDSDPEPRAKRVLTPEQAYVIQEVMKGVVTSGTGTAAAMYNGQPVAGKTGTSEDYKDIAFVGYTPFLAAAIWVGDPMNVSAVPTGSCADVFRMFCTAVMENEGLAVQQFPEREYPKFKSYSDEKYHINSSGASYGDSSSSDSKSSEESEDSKKKSTNSESKKSQGNTTPTPTPTPAPAPAPEPAPTPTPTPEPAPTPTPTPEPAPTPTPGDGGGSDAGAGAGGS